MEKLEETAKRLASPGKGILASDESTGTIGKRLERAGLENTEDCRRSYRELMYTSDIGRSISGAIMFTETLKQATVEGVPFVDVLNQQGILPGIKVDEGLVKLSGSEETETKGLETLAERCKDYTSRGAVFAKWRSVFKIDEGLPSEEAIERNADQLADYAVICQAYGLVPIVEPEVLIDGDHSIVKFAEVNQRVLSTCISKLWRKGVHLEGSLLKPQMMIHGKEYKGGRAIKTEVAEHTLQVMKRCVPAAIPGIMFLSGGQSESEATVNLNEVNRVAGLQGGAPWSLSFSFGRALQASVLQVWKGNPENAEDAKSMASALAYVNGLASLGHYAGCHPSTTSTISLHENFRGWGAGASSL